MARRWLRTFGRSRHPVLAEARLTATLGVHGPQQLHVWVV